MVIFLDLRPFIVAINMKESKYISFKNIPLPWKVRLAESFFFWAFFNTNVLDSEFDPSKPIFRTNKKIWGFYSEKFPLNALNLTLAQQTQRWAHKIIVTIFCLVQKLQSIINLHCLNTSNKHQEAFHYLHTYLLINPKIGRNWVGGIYVVSTNDVTQRRWKIRN